MRDTVFGMAAVVGMQGIELPPIRGSLAYASTSSTSDILKGLSRSLSVVSLVGLVMVCAPARFVVATRPIVRQRAGFKRLQTFSLRWEKGWDEGRRISMAAKVHGDRSASIRQC